MRREGHKELHLPHVCGTPAVGVPSAHDARSLVGPKLELELDLELVSGVPGGCLCLINMFVSDLSFQIS